MVRVARVCHVTLQMTRRSCVDDDARSTIATRRPSTIDGDPACAGLLLRDDRGRPAVGPDRESLAISRVTYLVPDQAAPVPGRWPMRMYGTWSGRRSCR